MSKPSLSQQTRSDPCIIDAAMDHHMPVKSIRLIPAVTGVATNRSPPTIMALHILLWLKKTASLKVTAPSRAHTTQELAGRRF